MDRKKERQQKRLIKRKLDHFAHILAVHIRPLIKEEKLAEFDEITLGLLQAKEDLRQTRRSEKREQLFQESF